MYVFNLDWCCRLLRHALARVTRWLVMTICYEMTDLSNIHANDSEISFELGFTRDGYSIYTLRQYMK